MKYTLSKTSLLFYNKIFNGGTKGVTNLYSGNDWSIKERYNSGKIRKDNFFWVDKVTDEVCQNHNQIIMKFFIDLQE